MKNALILLILLSLCPMIQAKNGDADKGTETTMDLLTSNEWKRTYKDVVYYRKFTESEMSIYTADNMDNIKPISYYLSDSIDSEFDERQVGRSKNGQYIILCPSRRETRSHLFVFRIEKLNSDTLSIKLMHTTGGSAVIWTAVEK